MNYMQVKIVHNNNKITFITYVIKITNGIWRSETGNKYQYIRITYMLNKNDELDEMIFLDDIKYYEIEEMEI